MTTWADGSTTPRSAAQLELATREGKHWFPEDFGATGVSDDITYLTAAITGMSAGDTLVIRAGKVYRHSTVWDISKSGIRIVGPGEIRATAEATSAVWLSGDYIYVEDVLFTCPTVTTRGFGFNNHKLVLKGCTGARLVRPKVIGASGVGIFASTATDYVVDHADVYGTTADGCHNTAQSSYGKWYSPRVENSGDDGIATVSYAADAGISHHIDVYDPKVINSSARMFSIVGGQDVHYHNVDGDTSTAAGVYVACEAAYTTLGILRCSVKGRVKNANTTGGTPPDHGAVLVLSEISGRTVSDVVVAIEATNTRTAASRQSALILNNSGTASNVVIGPMLYKGTGPTLLWYTNAPLSNYTIIPGRASAIHINSVWQPPCGTAAELALTANSLYIAALNIDYGTLLTGLSADMGGTTSGNVLVALYDSSGAQVAHSSSTAAVSSYAAQLFAFTAQYQAPPGAYYATVLPSSSTQTFIITHAMGPAAAVAQGSYALPSSITPLTQGARTIIPIMATY